MTHYSFDKIFVVFQIEIDGFRQALKTPFASLQEISKIKDEEEVLFSVGTVFRIENFENIPGSDKNWYVQLKLVSGNDNNETSELQNELEKEFCDNCNLCNLGHALIQMGEYNKAE